MACSDRTSPAVRPFPLFPLRKESVVLCSEEAHKRKKAYLKGFVLRLLLPCGSRPIRKGLGRSPPIYCSFAHKGGFVPENAFSALEYIFLGFRLGLVPVRPSKIPLGIWTNGGINRRIRHYSYKPYNLIYLRRDYCCRIRPQAVPPRLIGNTFWLWGPFESAPLPWIS